MLVGKQIAKNY